MADLQEQCAHVRQELEALHQSKLEKRFEKYRTEYGQTREKEIRQEYAAITEGLAAKTKGQNAEIQRLKAEVKRVVGKYRVLKQSIQVNNSRIEEEVQRSLAKALSSATVNKSFVKRTSPYQASRSYQSINLNHGGSTASFQGPQQPVGKYGNVLADITQAVLDQASFRRETPKAERDRYD